MFFSRYAKQVKTIFWCTALFIVLASNTIFGSAPTPDQKPTNKSLFFLVVQYPKLLAAGVVAALYFVPIQLGFNHSKKLAVFSVIGGLIFFIKIILYKSSMSYVSYLLKNDPVQLQKRNENIKHYIFQQFGNSLSVEKFAYLVDKGYASNNIFLLDECTHLSCGFLLRDQNPQYRKTFEGRVVKGMLDQKSDNVCWISYGCGAFLQDLITAHTMLTEKPSQSLTIHFIDKNFVWLSAFLKYLGNPEGFTFVNDEIDDTSFNEFCGENNIAELTEKQKAFAGIVYIYFQVRQYVSFLKNTHKKASIQCFIHASVQDYLNDKKIEKFPVPDVITTVDIMDEDRFMGAASTPYIALCATLLNENPKLFNCWLDKSNGRVFLNTISLNVSFSLEEKNIEIGPETYKYGKPEEGDLSGICYIKKEILNNEAPKI